MADDLRQEQENYRQAEALRKQLEVQNREITVKLEESEQYSSRDGRRSAAKLATRVRYAMLLLSARSPPHSRAPHANDTTQAACAQVRELEAELENEQRKSRDALGAAKRFER